MQSAQGSAGPTLVGHRGAMAHQPENSLQSYALAEEVGVDEIELDVRQTRDGQLVVLHDATFDRIAADDSGRDRPPVADLSWDEVAAITVDSGRSILTLAEVYEATSTKLQVEIKDPQCVSLVASFFRDRPELAERTLFTSFDAGALVALAEELPQIPRGIIVHGYPSAEKYPEGVRALLERTGSSIFHCGWDGLTPEVVTDLHAAGYQVRAWPMRSVEDMQRAVDLGIDGSTADDPALARSWYQQVTGRSDGPG